jgi:hypothetical protein
MKQRSQFCVDDARHQEPCVKSVVLGLYKKRNDTEKQRFLAHTSVRIFLGHRALCGSGFAIGNANFAATRATINFSR